ncbi:MAG: TauD/TfdA family dioxygenase [Pseudomonadota bacterium]
MEIQPLSASSDAAFGAAVFDIDLARGVSPEEMRALTGALYEHRVLVIKDQNLKQENYLAFGREWGTPIPHVLDHMRMPGFPELLVVGNTEEKDRANAIRNGAALWHTDQSYEAQPASATMLYSIKAPAHGGQTQFCDMAGAYDALDASEKVRIERLKVAHKYGQGRRGNDEQAANPIINADQDDRVPVVFHPLVMNHPVSERPALYALGHGAHGIQGMPDDEADELIESLKAHVLQEQFIYRHTYAIGEVAIWDTWQTMHRATPIDFATAERTERLLWRISVRGIPNIYQSK